SASFGDQPAGIVSGVVFNDLNGNGRQDRGEAGIGGVTVQLVNGETLTTMTAGNGMFIFVGVEPGSYTVIETDPAGFVSTIPNSRGIYVPPGGSVSTSFGDQQAGTVSGVVFHDLNGNGTQDAAEPGLGGVTVELIGATTTRTTTTAGNGVFIFSDVAAAAYAVRETNPDGWASVTPDVVSVSVAPGGSATANFGDWPVGMIQGVAFDDRDGDGTQDEREPGLAGVIVSLRQDSVLVVSTTTAGGGSYSFANVAPGRYQVCADTPAGFTPTTVTCRDVVVPAAGSATASFGFQLAGTVAGAAFNDRNGNGRRDPGEPGLGGVTVALRRGGAVVATDTTTGDGAYAFANVAAGQYQVCAAAPEGFSATGQPCRDVRVPAGGSASAFFGFREANSVQGVVFNDFNSNGRLDPGEVGLGGVTVQLYDDLGNVVTTLTSGDGGYRFAGVTAGAYAVVEQNPAGFVSTSPDWVFIRLVAGGSAGANFGDQRIGVVSGVVYDDLNGNGLHDLGEPGIGGVTITLRGTSAAATTTTSGSGAYLFGGVIPGNYTVNESDPAGFFSTTPNSVGIFVFPGGGGGAVFGDQAVGVVAGVVYDDLDGDGVRDIGEAGLAGVTVELRQGDRTVMTTVTAGDGSYRLAAVLPGAYTVVEADPPGFFSTTPNERPVLMILGGAATADFGDRRGGMVAGVVFEDRNGNGRRDPDEPGIGGVAIALSNGETRTTDARGVYRFDGVTPGGYTVSETDPAGYVSTTPNLLTVFVAAGGGATASFGDRRTGSISGVVFDDVNGNRVQDAGERGIGGVTVVLNNGAPRTTTTTGDGAYRFDGVVTGVYTVVENDPAGYVSTTPNSRRVFIAVGGSASVNFGDQRGGTVSGVVFFDLDGDAAYDPGEAGFGMIQVQLIGETTRSAFTTGAGDYLFDEVAPGSYTVCVVPPAGLVNTTLNCQPVSVADGGGANANFGFQWGGTIGGVVFNDLNGNGVQDRGEPGIGGVQIRLINARGADLGVTTTAGSGAYRFGGLTTGRYTVVETDPAGFASSTSNTVLVAVEGGGSASANFGDFQAGAVVGMVFNDLNGNGRHDCGCGGEAGIGGVTVTLFRGGVQLRQTTTNGDGSYAFPGLVAGTYVVKEIDPSGFISSTPNEVTRLLPVGGSVGASFGDYAAGCIYGAVFHDVNGNRVREASERGLAGVLVTLKNASAAILQTVHTDGSGNYTFCDLAAATYIVEETDPPGYGSTTPNRVTVGLAPSASRRVDFGDAKLGSICGRKTLNPGARPVGGVLIELWNSTKTTRLATAVTASNGAYCFRDLAPGTYWLHEVMARGAPWPIWTPWRSATVRIGSSATVSFVNGWDPCVLGEVYADLNLDGERSEDEPALAGVHVRLLTTAGAVLREADTDGDGTYHFMDVDLGSYLVEVAPPAGWMAVTENPVAIALVDPDQGETINFGLAGSGAVAAALAAGDAATTGTLRGQTLEANGQGISGVAITVRDAQGNVIGQATTTGDGSYQMSALPAGVLTVIASDLPGYVSLTPNVRTVYLAPDVGAAAIFVDTPRDAGISGSVFRDDDGDGQRDPDEGGIGGVPVQLKQNGQVVQTYTTTVSGAYVFPLVDGVYEIVAANAENHVSTTADVVRGWGPAVIHFGDRFAGAQALVAQAGRAMIAGRVYNDADANGVAAAGERLLGGIVISLRALDGTEVMTATTTGNGEYAFLNLASGAYEVVAAPAPGFVAATPSRLTVWTGPDGTAAADFGQRFVTPGHGAVAGRVFDDLDGDGRLNPAEPPLVGVGMRLLHPDGAVVAQTTTAGDGSYLFDVAAGIYRLTLAAPAGFTWCMDCPDRLAVTGGQLSSVPFGLLAANTVGGAVFFDGDGDGLRSTGERGVGGILIRLYAAGDVVVGQATTSADGYYLVSGVATGIYTVTMDLPRGLSTTTSPTRQVSLVGGRAAAASFGVQIIGTLNGVVFVDSNGNDRLDDGESGLSGVQLQLTRSWNSVVQTTTTTSGGGFQFAGLPAGVYTATQSVPAGFTTERNALMTIVWLGGGGSAAFADRPVRTISGRVFHDPDMNAAMDSQEPGFGGAEVQLRSPAGAVIVTTKALGNGLFEFREVPAGNYVVALIAPRGFLATTPEQVTIALAADDSRAVNFGLLAFRQQLYLPIVLRQ
ncbi:MAG: hypothetical protein FJ011_13610, partial [Chloroflexi bacterium]|nr:hypothetical protein [Chloroflexota bacterium]